MSTTAAEFLEVADGLGAKLARDAIWQGRQCNWTGDSMELLNGQWQVAHRALGCELYSGTAGVALFLARLHQATRERLFATLARGAAEQAFMHARALPPAVCSGFFSGQLGVAWSLVQLGHLLDAEDCVQQGWDLLQPLFDADLDQQGLDLTSGSAGAVGGLLSLAASPELAPGRRDALIELARRHGLRLLALARRSERGSHWSPEAAPGASHGLCGFSHGASGMACALQALFGATQDPAFSQAGNEAWRYERSWFNPQEQNWPDLRSLYDPALDSAGQLTYMCAWCHGAPGIGFARLALHQAGNETDYLGDARAALSTTCRSLQGALSTGQGSFCLCHGLAGNAELLIEASRLLDEPAHLALAQQIGELGMHRYARSGAPWPCGVVGGGETPSLMLGLAGIGWFYLRLHDPCMPSILAWPAPP